MTERSDWRSMELDLELRREAEPHKKLLEVLADGIRDLRLRTAAGKMPMATLAQQLPARLRRLALIETVGDSEPACTHGRDVLLGNVPELERLTLRSERPLFHTLEHLRLEVLELEVSPLCDQGRWKLPALHTLDVDPHIESECDIDALDSIFLQDLPQLRVFSIRGYLVTTTPTLERSEVRRFLRRLEQFWVTADALVPCDGDVDLATTLLANAEHLEHLSSFVVSGVDGDLAGDLSAVQRRLPALRIEKRRFEESVVPSR